MSKTSAIEITFPVGVDLPNDWCRRLDELLSEVCQAYEAQHRDRVMWPFGHGQKITYMPMTRAEEEAGFGMQFDDSVYAVEISERERFDTEPYVPGDFDWCEAILALVGWGGWGRRGDWWNR